MPQNQPAGRPAGAAGAPRQSTQPWLLLSLITSTCDSLLLLPPKSSTDMGSSLSVIVAACLALLLLAAADPARAQT